MQIKRTAQTKRAAARAVAAIAIAAIAIAALVPAAAPAGEIGAEVLANSDIVALSRAGMAPQVIAAKIASSSNIFDVSSRGLLSLKENGVADDVIATMLAAGGGGVMQPATGALDSARLRRELENLASPGPESRGAAQAWLMANRAAALPELRRALTDREPAVRAAAVTALGDLRDAESLHAIRNLIIAPDPAVRRAAAQALYALGDSQSVNAAEQALSRGVSPMDGYIRLVGHAKLTRAAGALGQILSGNPDNLNRSAAAWSLGEIGRTATAGRPALERAIEADADAAVRRESAAAISKFHDSGSATLLMDACRRDPEVRTVALTGLAEYPESVEFLVGVMNLGADQIAANELETARASLYRLTGQDFGLDGSRWGNWLAANRGAFAAGGAATMGMGGMAGGLAAGGLTSGLPIYSAGLGQGGGAPAPAANVDVEAWSLIADAADIPMAPQVDAGASAGAPGLASFAVARPSATAGVGRPAAPPGAVDSSSIPMALSPNDFDAGPGFALPGLSPPSTQSIPAMDIAQGTLTGAPTLPIPPMEAQQSLLGIGSGAGSSTPSALPAPAAASASAAEPAGGSLQSGGLFRTWSSDPERGAPEPRAEDEAPSRTLAGFPGRPDDLASPDAGAATDAAAAAQPPADATAAADAEGQWRRVPAEELSGGLAGDAGADPFASPFPGDAAASPDAFATDPFASPADPFATPPADPFAAPSDATASPAATTASSASPFGDSPPALLPSGPIVTPMSASAADEADADPLRGFSLSLPGMEATASDAADAVSGAAQSFADGVADAAAMPFADTGAFVDDGGIVIDDSGNVFPLPDAGGVSFMPEDDSIPAYDPAAQPGETVLFGDELGNMVDFGGADFAGGLDSAGLGEAEAFASDPFAAPADGAAAQPGETVIFAPVPVPAQDPAQAGTDAFGGLPALDGLPQQGADGFSQSVESVVQGVESSAQSVGNAAQSVNTSLFVEPEAGQVMVDENWTGTDFPAPQTDFAAPAMDFPAPQTDSPAQIDFAEPAVATESFPFPAAAADSVPAEAEAETGAATYANPYEHNPPPPNPAFITTDPNFVPPIRDYTEPYRPPAAEPPALPGGRANAAAPAGRAGSAKAAAPAPGDEMPRMLGEGFFSK